MFVRSLYDNIKAGQDWDQSLSLSPEAISDLKWIIDCLHRYNGRILKKKLRQHGLLIDVDSSEFSHAAKVFDLATGEFLSELTAQYPVHLQGTSSTLREATGISLLASKAFDLYTEACMLKHCYLRIHVRNDNQSAVGNFQQMKAGSLELLHPVHEFYELCMERDVQPTFEWLPRTSQPIQAVDAASKRLDPTDIRLTNNSFDSIVTRRFNLNNPVMERVATILGRQHWGLPTTDVFASVNNNRAPIFFTKGYDQNTAGIDAYAQPWPVFRNNILQLYWIFLGPVTDQLPAIRKLTEERCDAIFIAPTRTTAPWLGSLRALPIVDTIKLNYRAGLYEAGPSAPPEWNTKPPVVPLTAYFISWL